MERERRLELLILLLAKFHVLVELSGEFCPLCRRVAAHDAECPISLAWSLLDREQQADARKNIRAVALSLGPFDECSGTSSVH